MIIGTTPTHEFVIPSELTQFNEIHIIYAQNDKIVLLKTKENCTIEKNKISVQLTQDETFRFDPDKDVEIQLRLLIGREVLSSGIVKVKCQKCLETEILK